MKKTKLLIASIITLASLAACTSKAPESAAAPAAAPAKTLQVLASTRQIMLGITTPASDVLFGIAEKTPADDAEWEKVQASAMSLAESANLLKVDGRRIDTPDWLDNVDKLITASRAAAQAAQEKNVDKVQEAGDQVYEVCEACHMKYLPQG